MLAGVIVALSVGFAAPVPAAKATATGCDLGNGIKHVVILQFDNVHNERDISGVPSDLEQMPALRNFITQNGTLLTNDHTVLISHTSDGFNSTETGLYPDRSGITVGNSYQYYDSADNAAAGSNVGGSGFTSAFKYWTDPVAGSDDSTYNNDTTAPGTTGDSTSSEGTVNTEAPWVPYTEAGCNFAGLSAANMELENTTSDLTSAFGSGYNFGSLTKNATNLEGLAIHCSQAGSAAGGVCADGENDTLPSEPGGYSGYKALYGAFQTYPVLAGTGYSGGTAAPPDIYDVFAPDATNTAETTANGTSVQPAPVNNLDAAQAANSSATNGGMPPASYTTPGSADTSEILDSSGKPGFPGYSDQMANLALGETAAAQESGIPVTYTYLNDVHDDTYKQNGGNAFGPGQQGYENQLAQYNAAFSAFFTRLADDDINKSNTLFVVTVDEGDHFVGTAPTNPGCNGAPAGSSVSDASATNGTGGAEGTTPGTGYCNYASTTGEVDVNLNQLINKTYGDPTSFDEDYDDAPAVLVQGNPGPDSTQMRKLETEVSGASEFDPVTGSAQPITYQLADPTAEKILHEWNADPLRQPGFTLFGNDDFYFQDVCDTGGSTTDNGCDVENPGFAWNHGDDQSAISSTWQGWVGPGVQNLGASGRLWTDHTDVLPTIAALTGIKTDYLPDGRAINQIMEPSALPQPLDTPPNQDAYSALSAAYKQLNAPFGQFAQDALNISTNAVAGSTPSYEAWDRQLSACQALRQPLATSIDQLLNGVFTGSSWNPPTASAELARADTLLDQMQTLEGDAAPPSFTVCGASGQGPTGPQGSAGGNGASGQPGAPGPQGGPGSQGAPGPQGATGAKGATGSRGRAGASGVAKITCSTKIKQHKLVSVTCKQTRGAKLLRSDRVVVSLSRGTRILWSGDSQIGHVLAVKPKHPLSGKYVLRATVQLSGGRVSFRTNVRVRAQAKRARATKHARAAKHVRAIKHRAAR